MRTLVFEISGEYAMFRKPYSPMSPVSFPLPPPPAVLGMLGAVLGLDKETCHERLGWEHVRVAVMLRAPVRTFRTALNLLQTKDGTDGFFRPRADKNVHTQVPFEMLRQPHFRIFVSGLQEELADELAARLRDGRTAYTVTLGLASCLADLRWLGEWDACSVPDGEWQVDSVLPLTEGVEVRYEEARRYHRLRVPANMDGDRIVYRYQEVVLADDGQPIQAHGGTGRVHVVGSDTIAFL